MLTYWHRDLLRHQMQMIHHRSLQTLLLLCEVQGQGRRSRILPSERRIRRRRLLRVSVHWRLPGLTLLPVQGSGLPAYRGQAPLLFSSLTSSEVQPARSRAPARACFAPLCGRTGLPHRTARRQPVRRERRPTTVREGDRARHGGFPALSAAVRTCTTTITTRAVFTAASTTFSAGFVSFASTAMLTSRVATFSLGDALTYRGAVRISAVSESGVDRTAVDYHRGE